MRIITAFMLMVVLFGCGDKSSLFNGKYRTNYGVDRSVILDLDGEMTASLTDINHTTGDVQVKRGQWSITGEDEITVVFTANDSEKNIFTKSGYKHFVCTKGSVMHEGLSLEKFE